MHTHSSNHFSVGSHWPASMWSSALVALLLVAITVAITWGTVSIPPATVWRIAMAQFIDLFGTTSHTTGTVWRDEHFQIVWMIRMPRVLLAAMVGAGLAVVGVVMQAMVRNPLADPYLLGVSSGASVGAVSVLAFGSLAFAGPYALTASAFVGALAATCVVYALAHVRGRIHATRLILSGVAIGYVLTGMTSLITLTSGQRELAAALLTWMLGTLAGSQWEDLKLPSVTLLVTLVWLMLQARSLNALVSGEETAITLGVNTHSLRRKLFIVVSLVTGAMVAVSGAIGFVGLVIPHIARMLVGTNHQRVLPVAALSGAAFLVLVDLLARTWLAPTEIPVGVVTSLIGGPFFVWMLVKQGNLGGRAG